MMATEANRLRDAALIGGHPSAGLFAVTVALLLGQAVAASPWPPLPAQAAGLLVIPLPLLLFRRSRRLSALIVVAALAFSVGYFRHVQLLHPSFAPNHLRSMMKDDSRFYLEGWLRREPEKLPGRSRWVVQAERIWHPTGSEEVSGNIIVGVRYARREWRYGDRVRFWLLPQVPRDSGNPGGFNYAAYLADREIYATGFLDNDSEVELVARQPDWFGNVVESLRREIRRFIGHNFSHDSGALMKALVVGDMGEIPKQARDDFTAAGVNHVLSISGLHVGMLGLVVFALVRYGLGFSSFLLLRCNLLKVATFCSFIAVVFYTSLAGAMVPTVRSAIMIGVYELAVLLDREEEVLTSLTFAALLIGLYWPGVITDISFQLSFLAVLSIAWGMRNASEWLPARRRDELPQERSRGKALLRLAWPHLAVPLFATLGTGPLIAHYFGHLSLAGFLSNPLIVPLVGFVVVPLGLLIGFLSLTVPAAAAPLVWVADLLVKLTLWVVRLLANLPLANIGVPAPNFAEVALLYFFITVLFLIRSNRYARVAVAAVSLMLIADGTYWWRERYHRKELRVTHLNVGQGDAAVIEFPGSKVMVLDAGGTAFGDFDTGEAIVGPYLRRRKILKADYLAVSHARVDHYGGMRALVNEFAPAEFWSGPAKAKRPRFDDLEEAVEKAKITRIALSQGEPCRVIDGVKVCVLHAPPERGADASVVLRFEFRGLSYLLAGDIDKKDERLLQSKASELRSTVVKVPRHGSATASSEEFVSMVRPKLAIISAAGRIAGRPASAEVRERYRNVGAEVLRTDEDGAIIVETDGKTLRYTGYKSGKKGVIDLSAMEGQ
ncbi:MAG: DNA internalization-related competence protein ComEC/Rec2 [Deltaproteobacteria bacterium]|nr:DNA internalization-related competence protein ComEC/Rec2 [Deltaproteobacteria bacterium]